MARSRRLSAAFLIALALAALVAAATVAGGAERGVKIADGGAETTLQSQHTEPALTPGKRQTAEQVSFVVVAVLAALAGVATTRASARWLVRRRWALSAVPAHAVRLRGPPALLSLS